MASTELQILEVLNLKLCNQLQNCLFNLKFVVGKKIILQKMYFKCHFTTGRNLK